MGSKIEWTEETWNPVTGCDKVSDGCKHCYAEAMAKRLKAMNTPGYENGFEVSMMGNRLEQPLRKKKPTKYFVNSMSDLFHEKVPFEFIDRIFNVIDETPHHIYQILTKRSQRMADYFQERTPPSNAWIGVTVENQKQGLRRIDHLRTIDATIRFLSVEPLLEDLGRINLEGIDWVIVGGESGPKARPMKGEWAENIQEQCEKADVSFFFKQWGGWGADGKKRSKKENGRMLKGKYWDDMPDYQKPTIQGINVELR
ncbi:MAG: phage Gp37/Gp68 family protein [Pedobacter sp.]